YAADLSSLHLLGLLDDDDRLRIRSALPNLIVARAAVDDALLTLDHLRGVAAATYIASLAPDGTIERTTLSPVQQAVLREQAETLEQLTARAQARYPSTPGDAAASTMTLAAEHGLILWCDDVHLLQKPAPRSVGAPVRARPACAAGPGGGCGHSCTLRLCSAARPQTWPASKMTGSVWLAGGQGDPWLP